MQVLLLVLLGSAVPVSALATPPTGITAQPLPLPDLLPLRSLDYPVWLYTGSPEGFQLLDVQLRRVPDPSQRWLWQYRLIYQTPQGSSVMLASHPELPTEGHLLTRLRLPGGEPLAIFSTASGRLYSAVWGSSPGYFLQSPAPGLPGLPAPADRPLSLRQLQQLLQDLQMLAPGQIKP